MVCSSCGSRKVKYVKRLGPARKGPKYVTDFEGRKKLAPCNGEALHYCRKCQLARRTLRSAPVQQTTSASDAIGN
jgi:hypothetical protein